MIKFMFDANVGDGQHYFESNSFAAGSTPVIADLGDTAWHEHLLRFALCAFISAIGT